MNKSVSRGRRRMLVSLWLALQLLLPGALSCRAEAAETPADNNQSKQAAVAPDAGKNDQIIADKKSPAVITVKVLEVTNTRLKNNDRAGIDNSIIVKVDSLKPLLTLAGDKLDNIKLKIDGKVIPGLSPIRTTDDNSLQYTLVRDSLNTKVWQSLFAKGEKWRMLVPVTVTLAVKDSAKNNFLDMRAGSFRLVKPGKFNTILFVTGLVLFALTFLKLDKFCPWCTWWKCDARLRDYGPDSTYSLARVQMAVWYYVVTMSFLYLYFTSDFCVPELNDSTLTLLGISTAAKLGASVVDASKQKEQEKKEGNDPEKSQVVSKNADSESEVINPDCPNIVGKTPATSKHHSFIMDILSDEYGINLTRFQNVVWTLILVFIFVTKVAYEGAIPNFSDTNLLTLMGLSSGSYVLYKLKEAVP
jgi:hypothetical protein